MLTLKGLLYVMVNATFWVKAELGILTGVPFSILMVTLKERYQVITSKGKKNQHDRFLVIFLQHGS